MNLVEQLVQVDVDKAYELKRGVFKSERLKELLGLDAPVEVKIKELPQRKVQELLSMQYSSNGNHQMSKVFDSSLMCLVEGVQEPSLKDKELRDHFRAETPKKLAEVLFGCEVTKISDAIMTLSGYGEENEEEVKN